MLAVGRLVTAAFVLKVVWTIYCAVTVYVIMLMGGIPMMIMVFTGTSIRMPTFTVGSARVSKNINCEQWENEPYKNNR